MFDGDNTLTQLFWLASSSFLVCFVALIMGCVCGCRKKVPKNELLGLAGMVKIRNPDDQVIPLSSAINVSSDPNASKRANGGTATRSLPDLPVDQKLWSVSTPGDGVDTNSELYATVEDAAGRRLKAGASLESEPELVEPVGESYTPATDDSLSPYARLTAPVDHPYAQLDQPREHRYARVGEGGSTSALRPSTSSSPESSSPPSRASSGGSNAGSVERIPAASAIAGTVPANHDLPYMTPPIAPQVPPHFSGDSQDSGKGYTSISVREPLSRILGKDPHYATVSDVDSDDMYAAIEERGGAAARRPDYSSDTYARIQHRPQDNNEYHGASGSETYARIGGGDQPISAADYATSGSETYAQIGPRQPSEPPATYAQVSRPTHARQESWSSVGSGGSPRKEKREANSPLPQPPSAGSPLDAMYARVVKKRSPPQPTTPTSPLPDTPQMNGAVEEETTEAVGMPHYETVWPPGLASEPPYEKLQPPSDLYATVNKPQNESSNNRDLS